VTELDDSGLIARMRGGDEQALATLYDRWELTVRSTVLRIVDRPMDVEDVVEEVFWQAWRQADKFDSARGNAGAWLRTIARSRALDRRRQMSRDSEVELPELDEALVADEAFQDSTEDVAEIAERVAIVRKAVNELPADQRLAMEMAYYEGLSQSEIAERTSTPLGTVKTRMRLAIQKLRTSLVALGGAPA
jgi:RNA polymerase sigma-70 factor (ECF subfamily)